MMLDSKKFTISKILEQLPFYKLRQNKLQIETELELGRRLASGSLAHIGLLIVVISFTSISKDIPIILNFFVPALIISNLLRFVLSKKQSLFYLSHRAIWLLTFDVLLFFVGCLWGIFSYKVLNHYGLSHTTSSIILLLCSGVSAGAATSLNVNAFRAHLFIAILLSFPLIYLIQLGAPGMGLVLIFIVYYIFLSMQIKGQSVIFKNHLLSLEEISHKNELIEDALNTKSRFLATMSHEIRTPLNGIIGISNLIEDSVKDPHLLDQIKIIQNCSNSLLEIVNDVLDFSKLEANKVELEILPFAPNKLIQEVIELLSPLAKKKNLVLTYSADFNMPSALKGDETRIRQILMNLVSNALKFTESGSVLVSSNVTPKENKKWEVKISVKDTGIGIPESLQVKLFQSFSQVDASTVRKYGGTGLGLAICKGLCEKMGGTIGFESSPGKGSLFYFTFMAEETERIDVKASLDKTIDPELSKKFPLNILIADDVAANQIVTRGFLKKLGYQAQSASNGHEVLELLEKNNFDIIFMDCQMPICDGFEATRQIVQKYEPSKRPMIVALSASYTREHMNQCYEAGMNGFLEKPISLPLMIDVLKKCKRISKNEIVYGPNMKENNNSDISKLRPFDQNKLLDNFQNIPQELNETVYDLIQNLPKMMSSIELAIKNKNNTDLKSATHTLKGVAANFYAEPVRKLCRELEFISREEDFEKMSDIFYSLSKEVEILKSSLLEFIKYKKIS